MGSSNWRRENKGSQGRTHSKSHEKPRLILAIGSISFEIWTEAQKYEGNTMNLKFDTKAGPCKDVWHWTFRKQGRVRKS